MGNRLSFYFSQGSKNLRKSFLIIIGLSLALSMVSGISLYIDSYQKNLVTESFEQIIDFNVGYSYYNSYKENISDNFQAYDSSVISLIENSENIDVESHFRYFLLNSYDFNFYKNYSQLYGLDFHDHETVDGNFANMGLFDEQFYTSKRFDQYFSIINGTVPKSEEEILIPIDLAYQMNLTLGETTNLDIKTAWETMPANSSLALSDVKVVGIYATKLTRYYRFSYNDIFHDYTYYSENKTVTGYEDIGNNYMGQDYVFCYYNFSKAEDIHPVQTFIHDFNIFLENLTSEEEYYSIDEFAGLAFCFNRDIIDFYHLNSYSRLISKETQILERQIGSINVYVHDYLSRHLSSLYYMSNVYRIVLQILNVPILLFAIFIGSFAIKTNAKSRLDEFLLLRSKGSPNSLLRNQFFIEAIFNGVASSTIALIAGLGTFYGFQALLGDILFSFDSTVVLTPSISWGTVILTYALGIGITFIASLSSIFYVRKLPTDKLLTILGSDAMDVEYDEKSLFSVTEGKKVAIEETPFYEESQGQQNSAEIVKESNLKSIKKKRKKHDLYQNAVQTKEKKIPKLSIAFIIISLFPVIIYILYYLGNLASASDALISISEFIEIYFGIIIIFAILSPVLLVIGIIRILVVERPTRFARISKFLSSIFLKEKGYLCGIEMVKRKQYKTVILLVGIFTSLLVFTNVFLNSMSRYDLMVYNVSVGADAKVWYDNEEMFISSTAKTELLESQLKSYKTFDNETLINEVLTCYYDRDFRDAKYYLDFEKYLNIIQEDNKNLPINNFVSKIENLIEYNKNSSNTSPGVIVDSGFLALNKLEIGDFFTFPYQFYNSSSMELENKQITVRIMVTTDVMPGLFLVSGFWGSYEENMIVDINSINQDSDLLYGDKFFQMIDINVDVEENPEVLEVMLKNATSGYIGIDDINFYIQNWNDLNYELSADESGIYGIIYLEFLMIGVLLAFGLAILILSFQRENKYFNGVLLARGFGRRGLLILISSQISIIFLIGIFTGLGSGLLTSIPLLKITTIMSFGSGLFSFPLFANVLELVKILGIIVLSSFVIYLVSYYFESKKNITQYFHKF
ncbi:FtsX-like permease family protein [Promethearchaeum syntrophicum]|uniref:FtsX-like permease family protein n=1 Tax=Promethearchaeum syntrophicum TaxID=2594042 RepID=A0A5B9DBF7_9ARCH|nr:ABC transporter permease [Candidatus Prometheoarchaeum syntrophicum]QEE16508.1 FtsX-like permease family protein [Candidatus Prometheoarchaeum syntrophicum]